MEGLSNGYDNTNVMLWKLGGANKKVGQYLAVTDYPYVHEVDPDTLAVKKMRMEDDLRMEKEGDQQGKKKRKKTLKHPRLD